MVTVMRQKAFHKPNGRAEANRKAKGCFSKTLVIIPEPYIGKGKKKTKSMKQVYAELSSGYVHPSKSTINKRRNLRRRLATMKMPMPVSRSGNPKKNSYDRRPRHIEWPSERNPSPRYRRDGSVKQ
jgi:hypothetical protein